MSLQNTAQELDLATLEGIATFLLGNDHFFDPRSFIPREEHANGLYCPSCGGKRRMHIESLHAEFGDKLVEFFSAVSSHEILAILGIISDPVLLRFTCVQCRTQFMALIYQNADSKAQLAILPRSNGGLSTPNTPSGVAYYLDQAYKSQSTGAYSAAVAMFRGALEHLLFNQGYHKGMLGTKLQQLDTDIQAATAPKWAMELDTDYLDVMKDLGNGAIHPNDGDVKKQSAIDADLLHLLTETFSTLLLLVYEIPHQKQANLGKLQAKVQLLKK